MAKGGVPEGQNAQNTLIGWIAPLLNMMGGYGGTSAASLLNFLNGQGIYGNPLFGANGIEGLLGGLNNFRLSLPNMMNGFNLPPEIQTLLTGMGVGTDRLQEIINARGVTPETQNLRERLQELMTGTPETTMMRDRIDQILRTNGLTQSLAGMGADAEALRAFGGMTAQLSDMRQTGADIVGSHGRTPESEEALGTFKRLMDAGGMTPQMTSFMSQIQQGLQSGGMTPEARQLFGKVMEIVNAGGAGGAVLPMQNAISFARDASAQAYAQAAEGARRSAMQRVGSSLAAGPAEQALAEFADEAARGEGQATREAALGQQDLQLKQLIAAMSTGGDITKAAQALLGQYAGAGADVQRTAAANLGTASSGFSDTMKNEMARMGVGADMIKAAEAAALGRSTLGANLGLGVEDIGSRNVNAALTGLQNLTTGKLDAARILAALSGTEMGTMSNSLNTLLGFNTGMSDVFSTQQKNYLSQFQTQADSFLKSMGLSGDISHAFDTDFLNASGQITNIAQLYASIMPSLFSSYGGVSQQLIQAASQPGFWTKFLTSLAGGVGQGVGAGLTGGLGNVISGGPWSGPNNAGSNTPGAPRGGQNP